jgi:hypothetical protein
MQAFFACPVLFTDLRSLDAGIIGIYPLDAKAPFLWMPTESIHNI